MKKVCLNPECRKQFEPGHYGKRQKICGSPECRRWYRLYWRQTRRPPRGLTPREIERIAGASSPLMRSLIICARETGLRKGELLGLEWGDLEDSNGGLRPTIEIRGQWVDGKGFVPTKTRRSRLAYFSRAALAALREYRKSLNGQVTGRIWPISESGVWIAWTDAQKRLGIKNPDTGQPYRFHDLRHTVGLELVRAGRIDLAKRLLGHSRLETTLVYSEQSPEDVLADVERIRRKL